MPISASSLTTIREAAREIASASGYRLVVLFGSAARGDATHSDLDIGILSRGPIDVIEGATRFSAALRNIRIDIVDLSRANPVLLMAVAREGVPLFEQTGSEFAEFSSLAMRRYADTKKYRDAVRDDIREYARINGSGKEQAS